MARARDLLLLPVLLALALGACGDGEVERAAPLRVRLVEGEGALVTPAPAAPSQLLREDFSRPLEGWSLITSREQPLEVEPGTLDVRYGSEEGRSFLTLAGRKGGVYTVLPIEPDRPYVFAGRMRARGVVPGREPFFGATLWLGELDTAGGPETLFQGGGWFKHRHAIDTAAGRSGWQDVRVVFRSAADTRSLIVGAILAVSEEVEGGEIDFAELSLARVDPLEYWESLAAEAVAEAQRGAEPPRGWRARRSVGAMLGGEHRPALLVLPGERLRLSLDVPPGAAVMETGLAPWPRDHRPRAGGALAFSVRADGREVLRESLPVDAPLSELGWRAARADLSDHAGRRVELELSVEGPAPGLFGAAVVYASDAPPPGWNVLLVSIDTLRADRVGAYGYGARTTPRIDELAARSSVFTDASSQAPYTLPAHASLFSGQFPLVHGVEGAGHALASRRSPLLAPLLARRGYRTQAFTAGGFLVPAFGFHAGFDGFSVVDPLRHAGSDFFAALRRNLPEQLPSSFTPEPGRAVREWLRRHSGEPFFLFLHTYEVHDYDPPQGYTTCAAIGCTAPEVDYHDYMLKPGHPDPPAIAAEVRAHIGHLYDAALRHVDEQLGGVLDELERLGLSEHTLVVLTSDHGEELFERGFLQHGKTLYEELTRVPLIVHVPGLAAARVSAPAQLVDVAPTVLGALGLAVDARMQGVDLLRSRAGPRPVWTEVDDDFARKLALRDPSGWKLIHGPLDAAVAFPNEREWELYDLGSDPLELLERSAEEPERLARLRAELATFEERLRSLRSVLGEVEAGHEVDQATRLQLDHLGYGGREE